MQGSTSTAARRARIGDHLRAVGALACIACGLLALYPFPTGYVLASSRQWGLLLAMLVLSVLWQLGLRLPGSAVDEGAQPCRTSRRVFGVLLTLGGAALWGWATDQLYRDWNSNFDRAWLGWLAATVLMGFGLDLTWGRWGRPSGERRMRVALTVAVIVLIGGIYRLWNVDVFPGPAGATQIEDLQFGDWGWRFLKGERSRWEFIGMAWVAALGIELGGPSLAAMRAAYATVGTLVAVPVFLWLRSSAGTLAGLVGIAFLAVSSWDVVVARIGFNPDILVVATVFAILVGPARRGRPSAYVWMGFLSGYILWEYIGYRLVAVFAVLGGTYCSLRDRYSGWFGRLIRPLLIVVLIASMCAPLFGGRIKGFVADQYLNGLNRARAVSSYYNEDHSWQKFFELRLGRALHTAGLLFYRGDGNPSRNVNQRPLVDPASALLMLIGFGYCVARPRTELFGLVAAGFVATAIGAMVMTSDFNALRMSVTIPYAYVFVGLAAAALYQVWGRAWGRFGRVLAALVLTAALGWSAYENTGFLFEYWNSQPVKIAQRNNLAFVSAWLRENVRDDEQVIGTAGRVSNALGVNDAQWLRGREIDGALEWDVETALRAWRPGAPTLLVVFSETDTMRTKEYLEEVFPGLRMEFAKDPLDTGGDVAWAHLTGPPENLRRFLTDFDCRGVQVAYLYRGGGPDDILMRVERVAPMISFSTFPSEAVSWFHRGVHPTRLLVQYRAVISIERVGKYRFWSSTYGGRLQLRIDGQALSGAGWIDLEAGPHRFEGDADFAPLAAGLRAQVFWHGPDTGGREELIPFYRIAEPDLSCVARRASVETDGDRTQIPPPPGRPSLP